MLIWDVLQGREVRDSRRSFADGIHARQVLDIAVATSSEHGACVLAIRYGLARANVGHVSIQKLAKVTRLPRKRCEEIMADIRDTITRAGGLG